MSVLQKTQLVHEKLREIDGLYAQALEQKQKQSHYADFIHQTYTNAKQYLEREAVRLDELLDDETGSDTCSNTGSDSGTDKHHVDILAILATIDSRVPFSIHSLIDAISNNNVPLVMFLLAPFEGHPDPSEFYQFPIEFACGLGHIDIVRLLLKDLRVDPGAHNNSAICHAVFSNHPDVVRLLLADPRVDPTIQRDIVFEYAVDNGYVDIVTDLYGRQQVYSSLTQETIHRVLIHSCETGNYEIFQLFLTDSRINPSIYVDGVTVKTGLGFTSLMKSACENGHHTLVRFMLNDPRFNWSYSDKTMTKTFIYTCSNGHTEVVRMLLQDGRTRPTLPLGYHGIYETAIRSAIINGHTDIVRLLLEDKTHEDILSDLSYSILNYTYHAKTHLETFRLILSDARVVRILQNMNNQDFSDVPVRIDDVEIKRLFLTMAPEIPLIR